MSVPDWVQDAIFYQIFPDRFANGDTSNDPPNVQRWGSPPTVWGFQGGDLTGIIQKLDYLLDLGVTAVYLNPIFHATSNHRYNTTDYYKIDPKLGTMETFRGFLSQAHQRGLKVVLDGVFNHCGRGFFAFNDILENQSHSPYLSWFHLKGIPVDAYSSGEARDYVGWWGYKSLPKFNTDDPAVSRYLLGVARYWIEQGVDGWRLDVPNEINDDSFWAEFRHIVKTTNPEAYIVGEIWNADPRWVGEAHFDGLLNYPLYDAVMNVLNVGGSDIPQFDSQVQELLSVYPRENTYAMYLPLGSHDTERLMTKVNRSPEKAMLAMMIQFAFPGAPAVYYGDEVGLTGGKDPECRAAFPWNPSQWNQALHDHVRSLIGVRKASLALRRGDFLHIWMDQWQAGYAFGRISKDEQVLVVLNISSDEHEYAVPVEKMGWKEDRKVRDLLQPDKEYPVHDGQVEISLPAWGGVYLS